MMNSSTCNSMLLPLHRVVRMSWFYIVFGMCLLYISLALPSGLPLDPATNHPFVPSHTSASFFNNNTNYTYKRRSYLTFYLSTFFNQFPFYPHIHIHIHNHNHNPNPLLNTPSYCYPLPFHNITIIISRSFEISVVCSTTLLLRTLWFLLVNLRALREGAKPQTALVDPPSAFASFR